MSVDSGTDDPAFAYKPSMFAPVRDLRLTAQGLAWQAGFAKGLVPYGDVRRVRLGFRPMTLSSYRFTTEIWPEQGGRIVIASTSWKSMVEFERRDAAYRDFVQRLHERLAAAGSRALFQKGSPPLLYWPGVAILVTAAVALLALVGRALQAGTMGGALFVAGFLGLFLWQAGGFFWRNRPGAYRPDTLPEDVLPRAR